MCDLKDFAVFEEKARRFLADKNLLFTQIYGGEAMDADEMIARLQRDPRSDRRPAVRERQRGQPRSR